MGKVLFIQRKDLLTFTGANGNVDTDKLLPSIQMAQDIDIQRLIGTDLYEKLKADITGNTLTGDYLELVDTYIKPCLIHYSMMYALPYLSITIANGGVYRNSAENAQSLSKDEIDYLVEKERDSAQYYSTRLIDYLNFNASSKFSEYYTNSNADISPESQDNFGGWVIN
tara:strand:+ start:1806 stop:2312 length:507 start_codon:yes stop_codon:yes gene_type:complete